MAKGIVVAGLRGGSGKSIVAVGLVATLARQGRSVVPFKKGPDYIDAGWLQLAAGKPCYNLDPYLMTGEVIKDSFARHSGGADRVIVEGNRGLFDGVNSEGAYSTAELAHVLGLPVLLVVDCTKVTRTVAALVLGCRDMDPQLSIAGVVLNRLGTSRHETVVRQAVEQYTDIPVVGAMPRSKKDIFPQRHLGVTPHQEHEGAGEVLGVLAEMAEQYLDTRKIEELMEEAAVPGAGSREESKKSTGAGPRIGILKDAAFQFYYPENLEALEKEGAELVEINAMTAPKLPPLHGLYIGGGFPETSAGLLAANTPFRRSVKAAADAGLPIYAECGGLIYLGEKILLDGKEYPLAGVFPVSFGLEQKPQAHGYTELSVRGPTPFYNREEKIRGHEFRYSTVLSWPGDPDALVFEMKRGVGFMAKRDGLVYRNVLALYTHIHALATPAWAGSFVARARAFREAEETAVIAAGG